MTSSLDMIRGRSNVVTLTNNSGGALVAGDVCIQDTSADEKATTTTSAASVLKVFVAYEAIANGATGRFYESGYCPLVNVNASVTRGRFLFTHTVAKQAAENATYGAGAFGKILKSGTTPSAIIYSATAQAAGGSIGGSSGSTDNAVIRADGTGGATVQSSLATVDDSGTVNIPTGQTYNINNSPHTHAGVGVTHTYYGYNTVGGSTVQMAAQRVYMKKITLASAGTLVNIAAYLIGLHNQVFDITAVVFDDSAGSPRHIIAMQGNLDGSRNLLFDLNSGGGGTLEARWYHMPVAVYLAAGDYWIGVMASSSASFAPSIYYDGSGSDKYYDSGGAWIADAGYYTVSDSTNKYSIRASVLS